MEVAYVKDTLGSQHQNRDMEIGSPEKQSRDTFGLV